MEPKISLSFRLHSSSSSLCSATEDSAISIFNVHQPFPWGERFLSYKKQNQNNLYDRKLNEKISTQKIDSRVFTDIQSKGLSSRIVKYYENSFKLERSLSVGNLYYRHGQFPVVHLKKTEIPHKTNSNNYVSMVRIAPPDKSVFQANTRASILRSSSIVTTVCSHKSDDDISRENRPILHPADQNEIKPTRSVLDDLKEISRKRINSDQPDCNDSMKKYCKDVGTFSVATKTVHCAAPSKRQREFSLTSLEDQTYSDDFGIKRRMFSNCNNDITSSLSSSLNISTPKHSINENDVGLLHYIKSTCKENNGQLSRSIEQNLFEYNLNRTNTEYSNEHFITSDFLSKHENDAFPKTFQEQKLTLFNKNYDGKITKEEKPHLKAELKNKSSCIRFVKPKKNTSESYKIAKNSILEKSQKSKLELMLSGLRGDLDCYFREKNQDNDLIITDDVVHVTCSKDVSLPIIENISNEEQKLTNLTSLTKNPHIIGVSLEKLGYVKHGPENSNVKALQTSITPNLNITQEVSYSNTAKLVDDNSKHSFLNKKLECNSFDLSKIISTSTTKEKNSKEIYNSANILNSMPKTNIVISSKEFKNSYERTDDDQSQIKEKDKESKRFLLSAHSPENDILNVPTNTHSTISFGAINLEKVTKPKNKTNDGEENIEYNNYENKTSLFPFEKPNISTNLLQNNTAIISKNSGFFFNSIQKSNESNAHSAFLFDKKSWSDSSNQSFGDSEKIKNPNVNFSTKLNSYNKEASPVEYLFKAHDSISAIKTDCNNTTFQPFAFNINSSSSCNNLGTGKDIQNPNAFNFSEKEIQVQKSSCNNQNDNFLNVGSKDRFIRKATRRLHK